MLPLPGLVMREPGVLEEGDPNYADHDSLP